MNYQPAAVLLVGMLALTLGACAAEEWKPDVVFNLLEEFHGISNFDAHVVSYLELLKLAYTGCNPRGLALARSKIITKKLAAYHRVRVPAFFVVPRGRKVRRSS